MADAVSQARKAGYSDQEIFAYLTKGREKELQEARDAGYNDDQILSFLSSDKTSRVGGVGDPELTARRVERARDRAATENLVSGVESDPARSGSDLENVAAGFGKSFVDVGRGIKQLATNSAGLVFPSGGKPLRDLVAQQQADIDEARTRDKPLMRTGAGFGGNITGTIAQTAPLMMIPGGTTIAGSALTGAGIGAVQPVATGESRTINSLVGGAAGAAAPVAARTVGAIWRGGKALVEPLSEAGRQRIAGRVMQRYGIEPTDLAGVTDAPTATGARLTLPEQITRPEGAAAAARLQDNLRAANPELAAKLAAREGENNAARVATLEGLSSPREAAAQARTNIAGQLYKQADKEIIDVAKLPPAEQKAFASLLERPAIKQAAIDASENAANSGTAFDPASVSSLHEMKLAIDDKIGRLMGAAPTAATGRELASLRQAQGELVKFIEKNSSAYAGARSEYSRLSAPVNQADIADELLRRGSSNTSDLSGAPRLMPNALTGAVRDPAKLMKQATGRDLGAKLSDVLEPQQLAAVNAVVGEVDRAAAVARAANGPGSATAQRLAGSNVIQQTLERSGLPASAADSVTVQEVLARPLNFLYKGAAEPKLQMTLGELLLNPSKASAAMAAIAPNQRAALANVLSNKYLQQAARQSLPASAEANRR